MNQYYLLRQVSRTFALSIEQLPSVLRSTVATAYLLFRIADTIEDHPVLKSDRKASLLELWSDVLKHKKPLNVFLSETSSLDRNDPEIQVIQNAPEILQTLDNLPPGFQSIVRKHVVDTSLGMARWQNHGPFVRDEEEMDDYMHQVAGRVGYLLTDVFSIYNNSIMQIRERLMPLGRQFGLALQTVNIIRGIRKDYERGWVFIPEKFYHDAGLNREDLFRPENLDRALQVLSMLTSKAEKHLKKGLDYICMLPRTEYRIRLFCIWPLLFAAKTLAISRNNPRVFTAEAKISRSEVRKIVAVSKPFAWSNLFLRYWYNSFSTSTRPTSHAKEM